MPAFRFLIAFCSVLLGLVSGTHAAEIPIPPRLVNVQVDTAQVPVPVSGTIVNHRVGGAVDAEFRLFADLRPVQNRMFDIVRARLDRSQKCGDRIRVHEVSLRPQPPAARLTTRLTYARAACVGQGNQKVATKLFEQRGAITVDITPIARDGKAVVNVRVVAVEAKSPLRQILSSPAILQPVADRIARDGIREVEKLVPPPIARLGPAYQQIVFVDRGAGALGLDITARRQMSDADLQSLVQTLR